MTDAPVAAAEPGRVAQLSSAAAAAAAACPSPPPLDGRQFHGPPIGEGIYPHHITLPVGCKQKRLNTD